LGSGGASAVAATILLALGGSSGALAQVQSTFPVVRQAIATQMPAIATVPVAVAPTYRPASLSQLVEVHSAGAPLNQEQECVATAVYFESQGESLEGQLAVAQVVLNRAASGQYPASLCAVVKQKAQFSFVRNGRFPRVDTACESWRKAQAITRIATQRLTSTVPTSVLWYHANYVAPKWRLNLKKVDKIGAHIFYRA
jgi:spore germination cell wall hydrolase CwlJ-like protein